MQIDKVINPSFPVPGDTTIRKVLRKEKGTVTEAGIIFDEENRRFDRHEPEAPPFEEREASEEKREKEPKRSFLDLVV